MSDALAERNWWDRTVVDGTWQENTEGVPPYDVEATAERVLVALGLRAGPLLDLGCGTGRLTRAVSERITGSITAVDVSRELLKRAVTASPNSERIDYRTCDGRELPPVCFTHPFNGAYAVTVFQHIPFEAQVNYLKQVWSCLLPGRKFTFTVAVGDEDQFLNHQIADIRQYAHDLKQTWSAVEIDIPIGFDYQFEFAGEHGWTWVTLTR